jgi:hypothetical protein
MAQCSCDEILRSFGISPCSKQEFGSPSNIIIFPTYQADGVTLNGLPITSGGITPEIWSAKLYNADVFQRFQSLNNLKELNIVAPTTAYKEYADKTKRRNGVESAGKVTATVPIISFEFMRNFNSSGCVPLSMYIISDSGNIQGQVINGQFVGIPIDPQTLDAMYQYALKNQDTMEQINISFDVDIDFKFENLEILPASYITANLKSRGVLDVDLEDNGTIVGTVKFKATLPYGNTHEKVKYTGLASDFVLKNSAGTIITTTDTTPEEGAYQMTGTIPSGEYTVSNALALANGYNVHPFKITVPA